MEDIRRASHFGYFILGQEAIFILKEDTLFNAQM